ncbi:uncharacterized protein LOC130137298 isoform X1 [Syzygium oleosum]|uniref:uncharacterized protein LOC130137298 isoform X1 n=1 Tax=Syzygium oleosum TaxID=219896 RepID=UPI0024BAEEAC|nr:uncharacterized protein LOC130137298 isoform X1 [Syzygium oleosum]
MAGRWWNSTMGWYACPCASPSPSPSPSRNSVVRLNLGFQDIAEIAHNKVLISAGVSAAIGQLSKPFTSPEGDARKFDFSAAIRSGGFPSTHSAAVVATATSLSFERGFSDSIFGLSVVYAALVMYDSQGVRREVGKHARMMNEALLQKARVKAPSAESNRVGKSSSSPLNLGQSGRFPMDGTERGSFNLKVTTTPLMLRADDTEETELQSGMGDDGDNKPGIDGESGMRLKESVGHTEVEVLAGAILGFVVSMVANTLM